MNKLNFLQPDKNNFSTFLYTGVVLVALSISIVFVNSFFNKDLISFLPGTISFFLPLILGFIGLHLIRIDYSGMNFLDKVNKNINTNNFNAFLSFSPGNLRLSSSLVLIIVDFYNAFKHFNAFLSFSSRNLRFY